MAAPQQSYFSQNPQSAFYNVPSLISQTCGPPPLLPPQLFQAQSQQNFTNSTPSYQQQQPPPKILLAPMFLINAHRVGMRAMDMLGLRNADDCRSFAKYSRTPMFSDEIRWLFEEVSVQLGDPYVHSFCEKAANFVASPFLLHHLVKEAIKVWQLFFTVIIFFSTFE